MKKILIRLNDNLIIPGNLEFVEYDSKVSQAIKIDDTIIAGGYGMVDWEDGNGIVWRTSKVVEKISEIEFKTKDSHYVIKDGDEGSLNKLIVQAKAKEIFKGIRHVFDARYKPIIRKVRTRAEIQEGSLRAKNLIEAIEKAKKIKHR